jgi:metal-sulfur cluster biosynthetic enzyme
MTTEQAQETQPAQPTTDEIMERLRAVEDPEIRLSIVELGLVYGVEYLPEDQKIVVTMTLTSPGCPLGGLIEGQAYAALRDLPGVKDVDVNITFSPPWDPRTMASEDVKMMLGIW